MLFADFFDHLARFFLAATLGATVYAMVIVWQGGVLVDEIGEVAGWLAGPFGRGKTAASSSTSVGRREQVVP